MARRGKYSYNTSFADDNILKPQKDDNEFETLRGLGSLHFRKSGDWLGASYFYAGDPKKRLSSDIYFRNAISTIHSELKNPYLSRVKSIEWCKLYFDSIFINWDLNQAYFQELNHDEFDESVSHFSRTMGFEEYGDITQLKGCKGYYMMVLDEYSQAYIGRSDDIYKRIRSHWSAKKEFSHSLWGGFKNSIISIDAFLICDTTRVFGLVTEDVDLEEKLVDQFDSRFLLNRVPGSTIDNGLEKMEIKYTRDFTSLMTKLPYYDLDKKQLMRELAEPYIEPYHRLIEKEFIKAGLL